MKCLTPEIAWHDREPVFSVDVQPIEPDSSTYRLASAGADTHIVVSMKTPLQRHSNYICVCLSRIHFTVSSYKSDFRFFGNEFQFVDFIKCFISRNRIVSTKGRDRMIRYVFQRSFII